MKSSLLDSCGAGLVSGVFSSVLLQPLEVVKTRMQAQTSYRRLNFMTTFTSLVRNEGSLVLWSGLTPSLYRVVPGVVIYFPSLQYLQTVICDEGLNPTPMQNMMLGSGTRGMVTVITLPASVLKARFESNLYQYPSVMSGVKSIIEKEGIKGLYSGFGASLCRDALYAGFYLVLYRSQQQLVPQEYRNRSSPWSPVVRFTCGLSAGFIACCMTMPFDFVKTNMQLQPHLYPTTMKTVLHFYKSDGWWIFFRGMVPRAIRRGLMAALSWTIYEELVQYRFIAPKP